MRLVFMGTPDFAVPTLDALVAAGHEIAAVYTQPPRPAGRGKAPQPTPVHRRAEALGLAVRHPASLRDPADRLAFAGVGADAAVVAAYGLILPQAVLDAPRLGCFNVHASLLPRWRGAAPVHRAILAGDAVTGVTIMRMARGLDTGPMLARAETPVGDKTSGVLTADLAHAGAALMATVLADLGNHPPRPQPDEGVTYAAKIEKREAALDFTEAATQVLRRIRAFAPTPGAFVTVAGERLRILSAEPAVGSGEPGVVLDDRLTVACRTGAIRPSSVQRAGRGVMAAADLLRGFPVPPGTRL